LKNKAGVLYDGKKNGFSVRYETADAD